MYIVHVHSLDLAFSHAHTHASPLVGLNATTIIMMKVRKGGYVLQTTQHPHAHTITPVVVNVNNKENLHADVKLYIYIRFSKMQQNFPSWL